MRVIAAIAALPALGGVGVWVWLSQDEAAPVLQAVTLPSGLEANLQEVRNERTGDGLVYRFRFVADAFTGTEDFEQQSADLEYLCTDHAAQQLKNLSPAPSKVIVSLADQPSEFGVFNPEVVQIFESFSFEDGACIWEMF